MKLTAAQLKNLQELHSGPDPMPYYEALAELRFNSDYVDDFLTTRANELVMAYQERQRLINLPIQGHDPEELSIRRQREDQAFLIYQRAHYQLEMVTFDRLREEDRGQNIPAQETR
jgi:hypothetical protein